MKSCHRVKFANGEQSASSRKCEHRFRFRYFRYPFPNGVLNCRANGTATTTNTPCFATAEAISTTQIRLKPLQLIYPIKLLRREWQSQSPGKPSEHKNVRIYLKKQNAFYPVDMKEDYVAGSWPDDGVDVSKEIFLEFAGISPAGKELVRTACLNGLIFHQRQIQH
jgi:hypothetical protein